MRRHFLGPCCIALESDPDSTISLVAMSELNHPHNILGRSVHPSIFQVFGFDVRTYATVVGIHPIRIPATQMRSTIKKILVDGRIHWNLIQIRTFTEHSHLHIIRSCRIINKISLVDLFIRPSSHSILGQFFPKMSRKFLGPC
jgi:hypothetical protein